MNTVLPFPRGTFSDDGVVTVGDTVHRELAAYGPIEVPDATHGLDEPVYLLPVKNDTGSDITVSRACYSFASASQGDLGCFISGLTGAGAAGFPIDDQYSVGATWPANAWGYLVVKGRCDVLTASTNVNYAAGISVSIAANGVLNDSATVAAGKWVLGVLEYETAYAASTAVCVYVQPDFALPPAAG